MANDQSTAAKLQKRLENYMAWWLQNAERVSAGLPPLPRLPWDDRPRTKYFTYGDVVGRK